MEKLITVKLKPITQDGFCIDKAFVDDVLKTRRKKTRYAVINEKLCALIVAAFLRQHEDYDVREEKNVRVN